MAEPGIKGSVYLDAVTMEAVRAECAHKGWAFNHFIRVCVLQYLNKKRKGKSDE